MTSNWQKLLPTIKPQKKPTQPKPADSKPGSLKAKQSKVASTASKVSKKPVVKQAPVTVPAQLTASEPNKSLTPAVKRKRAHDDFLDSLLSSKSKKSNILESSTSVENEAQLSVDLLVAEASDHEVVHEPEPLAPKKTRGHSEDPVASLELEAERKSALSILDAVLKSEASAVGSQKLDIQEKADSEAPLSEAAMTKVGKYLAIDCEMVGVGLHGAESALARVSIVNFHGHPLLDTFVIPREPVTDYRTHVSGITPALIDISKNKNLITFEHAQQTVAKLIKDKIVVGHALKNDFKALLLDHPRRLLRDTSEFKTFKEMARGRKPALKKLAKQVLNVDIQGGEHSSVEDARVSMLLYKKYRASWESTILKKDK
ncbi:ribonuclease H-like domain-containing protein [Chytriomyces sp. MP71]|nr:ribonuclease H-like domain-containing protein [Chytriomyces sp. MP71]